jgi:hypothetical protein
MVTVDAMAEPTLQYRGVARLQIDFAFDFIEVADDDAAFRDGNRVASADSLGAAFAEAVLAAVGERATGADLQERGAFGDGGCGSGGDQYTVAHSLTIASPKLET